MGVVNKHNGKRAGLYGPWAVGRRDAVPVPRAQDYGGRWADVAAERRQRSRNVRSYPQAAGGTRLHQHAARASWTQLLLDNQLAIWHS